MSELRRQAREQKRRDRANRATVRSTGQVVEMVDATHARVDVGDRLVTAVVPGSVPGVIVGAGVVVRVGAVSVVESVEGSAAQYGYAYLPGGALICWDTVTITPTASGVVTGVTWTFPAAFSSAPILTATANSAAASVQELLVSGVTPTSATINLRRDSTTATTVHVIAVGPA